MNNFFSFSSRLQRFLTTPFFQDAALLLFRFVAGLSLATHGWAKIQSPEKFLNYLATKLSLPAFLGYAAIYAELLGGVFIALGFLLRPSAFFALMTMLVAAFYAHGGDPFSKKELSLLYAASCALLLALGGGRYGVDSALWKRLLPNNVPKKE
jgi:putative oxidoreductase